MTSRSFTNFDLSIERDGDHYRAHVLQSCIGEGSVKFELPFSALELENFILKMGHARRGMGRNARSSDSPELSAAKEFGAKLFGAVFQGDVYACLRASLEEAQTHEQGVRVLLRLPPELTNLPWEYLYNPAWNQFFSLTVDTPLVRYLELTPTIRPLAVKPPLRLLVVISSPSDYDTLDVEREWRDLLVALQPLVKRGLVVIERLESASLPALRRQLRQNEYHIFHFIGHGLFDERHQDGILLFTDENGRGRPLSGQDLGTLLRNHHSLRLALLNSCEGARTGKNDPFAGVAHSLVQMGLPAVIAMQFEISDSAAGLFAQEFYAALADGYGVDAALTDARTAIFASRGSVEWGTPVLFSRTLDGKIFDLAPTPPVATQEPAQRSEGLTPWLFLNQWRRTFVILVFIGLCSVILFMIYKFLIPGMIPSITASVTPTITLGVSPNKTPALDSSTTPNITPILFPSATSSITPTLSPSLILTMIPTAISTVTPTATLALPLGMVLIPAGSFQMGSNKYYSDRVNPIHTVTLSAFLIDMYEVTNANYAKCVMTGKCRLPGSAASSTRSNYYGNEQYANYPVVRVSWNDAEIYCKWRGARLPTEAEWEKAARGGLEGKEYSWGDADPVCTPGAVNGAQFDICAVKDTVKVGSFGPNGYGLYDMTGNAWEWVNDWYEPNYYNVSPASDPLGPIDTTSNMKVIRGGGLYDFSSNLRVAYRYGINPASHLSTLGFRCAASLP
jgi:formylglycine-generating enzyme required for sulfatase activity